MGDQVPLADGAVGVSAFELMVLAAVTGCARANGEHIGGAELQALRALPAGAVLANDQAEPGTGDILEVLRRAQSQLGDALEITDAAVKAAQQVQILMPAAQLQRTLDSLAEVVRLWQRNELVGGFAAAWRQRNLNVVPTSRSTQSLFAADYKFLHDGVEVFLGPHARLTRQHRVYWYQCEGCHRFIINHIGSHLGTK